MLVCCIFWTVFGCWALPKLVKLCFFHVFGFKKLKKQEHWDKLLQNFAFQVCTQILVEGWKCFFFLWRKSSTSIWEKTHNTNFLLNLASIFFLFMWKNVKKRVLTSIQSAQHPNAVKIYNTQASTHFLPALVYFLG